MSTEMSDTERRHTHVPELIKDACWKRLKRMIIPGQGWKTRTEDGEGGLGPRWNLVRAAEYLSDLYDCEITKFNVRGLLMRKEVYWETEPPAPKPVITLGGPEGSQLTLEARVAKLECVLANTLNAEWYQAVRKGVQHQGETLRTILEGMNRLDDDMTSALKFLTDRFGPMWRDLPTKGE